MKKSKNNNHGIMFMCILVMIVVFAAALLLMDENDSGMGPITSSTGKFASVKGLPRTLPASEGKGMEAITGIRIISPDNDNLIHQYVIG